MKVPFTRSSHMQFVLIFLSLGLSLSAQDTFLYGDALPDASEFSTRGKHVIGVRTLALEHKNQIDILNSEGGKDPLYNRKLTVEMWYPADLPVGTEALVTYEEVMGTRGDSLRPLIPFTIKGRAFRNAKPKRAEGKFPLIIVSHGYVGSRYLMSYLTENLASKGYVVVAIDHTDSTFRDAAPFQSTLLNRAQDVHFVLREMVGLGQADSKDLLAGLIDTDNTGIVGYSMGGVWST
jgi:platelet-activating factor acetylhydrolase isoform II